MDKAAALNDSKIYADAVRKVLSPEKIIMYGSYVYGHPSSDSDIDIAVIFNGFKDDWLKTSAYLWTMTESINTRIEPILLDIASDKSGFANEIMKVGIEI